MSESFAPQLKILLSKAGQSTTHGAHSPSSKPAAPQLPHQYSLQRSTTTPHLSTRSSAARGTPTNKTGGRTSGRLSRTSQSSHSSNRAVSLGRRSKTSLSPVEEDYELHEYEWPDLPPLEQIREALARGNISKGVRYLLPVDKSRNSIDGKFRTDLRQMFKTQYVSDLDTYDEEKIGTLTRFHFSTNTQPTDKRPAIINLHPREVAINHESERARQAYCQSAPSNGLVGALTTPQDLRARSSLNFPLKQKVPEEARRLKEEAERILKSVQERDNGNDEEEDEYDHGKDARILSEQALGRYRRSPERRRSFLPARMRNTPTRTRQPNPRQEFMRKRFTPGSNTRLTAHKTGTFSSYEDLKNMQVPSKRELPARLRTRFMSGAKAEQVWDWLNTGERVTEFSYFLEVCS